jgi:hypothetical protein
MSTHAELSKMLSSIINEEAEVIIPSGNLKNQKKENEEENAEIRDTDNLASGIEDEQSGDTNMGGEKEQDETQKKYQLEVEEDIEVDLNDNMDDGETDPEQYDDSDDIKIEEAMKHDKDELAHLDDEELAQIAQDEGVHVEYDEDGSIANRDEVIDTLMHIDEALDLDSEEDELEDDEDSEGAPKEDIEEEAIPDKRGAGRSADDENRAIRANGKYDAANNDRAAADRSKFDSVEKQEVGENEPGDPAAKAENDRIKQNYRDNQRKAGEKVPAFDVKVNEKHLKALFGNSKNLTESFKKNAAVVFEAAVKDVANQRTAMIKEHLEKKYSRQLRESVNRLVDKLDGYLGVISEAWMKENEIAVESGIRTKIAENLMKGIKETFERNYIDVPDTKIDLVKALKSKNKKMNAALNETTQKLVETTRKLEKMQRREVLAKESAGLSLMQAKKLDELASQIEVNSSEDFAKKVKIIK